MEYCKKRNCKQHLRYYYDGKEEGELSELIQFFLEKNIIEDKS